MKVPAGCKIRLTACSLALAAAGASTITAGAAPPGGNHTAVSFYIDNDTLSSREHDEDYTGGLSLALTGPDAVNHILSLDTALGFVDVATGLAGYAGDTTVRSFETGMTVFTPNDIGTTAPLPGDRPYASLIYISNTRQQLAADAESSLVTTLTLGVLGLKFPGGLQNAFHGVTHSSKARGWSNQVSDGGEPTFRYRAALQWAGWSHAAQPARAYDVTTSLLASVGYVTELAWSLSGRWGAIHSPWWTFNPQLALYGEKSVAGIFSTPGADRNELYWLAGITLHIRAYNAFLQGQFRDNPVEFSSDALNAVLGEGWIGITSVISDGFRVSYTLRGQAPDIELPGADRGQVWGSLVLSRTF